MQGARTTRTFVPELFRQFGKQPLRAGKRAGQRIADPHGDRRRRRLAFLHHVEMGVEGRDLIDLGERELHFLRQGGEMGGREMTVMVLNQMQMLDQEIAPARPIGQQARALPRALSDRPGGPSACAAAGAARRPRAGWAARSAAARSGSSCPFKAQKRQLKQSWVRFRSCPLQPAATLGLIGAAAIAVGPARPAPRPKNNFNRCANSKILRNIEF